MASDGSVTAISLLLFTAFTQVFLSGHFGMLDRSYSINTTVGQRVTLPCLQEKEHNLTILQIEWKKMEGRAEVKIAICNPAFGSPHFFWTNVSVSEEMSGKALKGSVLELPEVSVWDSGIYVCELITFPRGTVKAKTSLTVTERVSRPNVTYTCSEDAVTLTCDSTESKVKWALNGVTSAGELEKTLTVPGRPAHDAKYSCTAWNEASQEKSRDTTVRCEVQLSLKVISQNEEVREGEDVSILCASTPPADEYTVWTPRKLSLSQLVDGEFRLQNVTKDDGGTYLCQPRWKPPGPYDDAANATVQLHVSSGQALRGRTTPRVTSGSEGTLLLATHLLLVLCLSGPVV